MTLKEQVLTIAAMVVLAYASGISLSIHRSLFIYKKNRRYRLLLADLLFCISQSLLIFGVLYAVNGGRLRFYSFIIFGLTLLVYYRFHEKWVNKGVEKVFYWIRQMYHFVCRLIYNLFIRPLLGLLMLLLLSVKILKNLTFFVMKILYMLTLKPLFWIIWILVPKKTKEVLRNVCLQVYNKIFLKIFLKLRFIKKK